MDLKALLTRLEVLDKKQNLMESEDRKPAKEKERDVTLPSGAKVKSRTVQGWQSQKADKDADKESKKKDEGIVFKSGIANELLREFGLEEAAPGAAAGGAAPAAGGAAPAAAGAAADPNAVKQIQAMLKPNGQGVERLQNAIDPKTGIIYYGEEGGEGGQVSPKATPFNWIQKGQQKEFQDLVKAAGLSIVPVDQKTLFGTTKVAAVEPKGLANLGKAPAAAAPAAAAPAAGAAAGAAAGGAAPAAGAPAAGSTTAGFDDGSKITTTPGGAAATDSEGNPYIPGSNPNLPKNQTKTQGMDDGSKLTTGPGGVAATNDDGTPYVPGSNPNLPQNQKPGEPAAPAAPATAKPPAGGAGGDAAVEATRKRMKELLDKLEKTGGVSGSAPAPAAAKPAAAKPAAKPPVGGKPAAGGSPASQPDWNMIGASQMTAENIDDYVLKLIRAK